MSEPTPETAAPETSSEVSDFEPITSQEQLDKIMKGFENRFRSKIKDLSVKAARLDELEQASKSDTQRSAERIATLEAELASERQNTLRHDVASEKHVPAHRISGVTREELEESADGYLAEIAELTAGQSKPKTSTGLKSGATGTDSRMDPKEHAVARLRAWRSG